MGLVQSPPTSEVEMICSNIHFQLPPEEFRRHIKHLQKKVQSIDMYFLLETLSLRTQCTVSDTAYEVGAILVLKNGNVYTGYSRKTGPKEHAEEEVFSEAFRQGETMETISGATLYSSLEPCNPRATTGKIACALLSVRYHVQRVVIADREDATLVEKCMGVAHLQEHGVLVDYYPIAQGIHSKGKKQ